MPPARAHASARLAVAFAAASLLLPSTALGAGIGGFSVRPGDVNPTNPATRAYFIHTGAPGGSFTEHVVVEGAGSPAGGPRGYAGGGLTRPTAGAGYSDRQGRAWPAGGWGAPPA